MAWEENRGADPCNSDLGSVQDRKALGKKEIYDITMQIHGIEILPVRAPTFKAGISTALAGKSYKGSRRELGGHWIGIAPSLRI